MCLLLCAAVESVDVHVAGTNTGSGKRMFRIYYASENSASCAFYYGDTIDYESFTVTIPLRGGYIIRALADSDLSSFLQFSIFTSPPPFPLQNPCENHYMGVIGRYALVCPVFHFLIFFRPEVTPTANMHAQRFSPF